MWCPACCCWVCAHALAWGDASLNFSAAYALAFLRWRAFQRRISWWLPLAVMLGTDVVLNVCYYDTAIFSDYQAVNYVAYVLIFLLGRWFGERASMLKLISGGLLGAIVFYLVTNTAAWLENPAYAKILADWIRALTIGVLAVATHVELFSSRRCRAAESSPASSPPP